MNLEEISTTFTIFLVAIIVFFLIGDFTINVINKRIGMFSLNILDIGVKILIGTTLISAIIAIINSNAITIQTLILPLTIMFAYSYANSEKKNYKWIHKKYLSNNWNCSCRCFYISLFSVCSFYNGSIFMYNLFQS